MIEATLYVVVLVSILLFILAGEVRQRRLSAAYTPPWIALLKPDIMSALESIGKTPINRYIASVVLQDGSHFRSVLFECSYESRDMGEKQVRAVIGRTAIPVDPKQIVSVSESPDRVPNGLCAKALSKPESGMGYYRLNLHFKNGDKIKDFVCDCPDIIDALPPPHQITDILEIEHAGFH